MRQTKAQKQAYFYQKMSEFGFSFEEANNLRRIEMTLHRWAEAECNGEIQREELIVNGSFEPCADCGVKSNQPHTPECNGGNHKCVDGKPRRYYGQNMDRSYPVADREAGALKRLAKIMAAHTDWLAYHQTDPRGCALYIIQKERLGDRPIDSYYSQGFGVCF